jgi:Cu/Ag efflux protein CusF
MAVWKVVLLLNVALGVGLGWGWLWWGRELERRDRAALAAPSGGERRWQVRAVVRAVLADTQVLVVTHEAIPGFMPPMTMGFRLAAPELAVGVSAGDEVRLTLRGAPPEVVITAIEPSGGERTGGGR